MEYMLIVRKYMKTGKKTIIFDGSNLLHRCYWVTKVRPNVRVELLFLNSIKKIAVKYAHSKIFCVWDHRENRVDKNFRWKDTAGDYKSTRDKSEIEKVYQQCEVIQRLTKYLGVMHLNPEILEADDYIRWLTLKGECVVVSSDGDMLQLVTNECSVYNPIKDVEIDHSNFAEITEVSTTQDFILYKALVGDKSDNIEGLTGVGHKRALKIINMKSLTQLTDEDQLKVKHNIELIDLSIGVTKHINEETWYEKLYNRRLKNNKHDIAKFKKLCIDLNLNAVVKNINEWERVFDKTKNIENVVDRLIRLNLG